MRRRREGTALIDADVIVYRASAVAQQELDWRDGMGETMHLRPEMAVDIAMKIVRDWLKRCMCKDYLLCWSDRSFPKASFRYYLLPSYKGNRTAPRPILHDHVAEAMKEEMEGIMMPGLEGDDVLGVLLTSAPKERYVCVSIDKDMLTVPGRHFNPMKIDAEVRHITPRVADRYWMLQTLTGDTVDNFKGCPGIGEVSAPDVLGDARYIYEMWPRVVNAFRSANYRSSRVPEESLEFWKKHGPIAHAIQQAQCARILRKGDYNRRTKRVRVWHPEKPFLMDPLSGKRWKIKENK